MEKNQARSTLEVGPENTTEESTATTTIPNRTSGSGPSLQASDPDATQPLTAGIIAGICVVGVAGAIVLVLLLMALFFVTCAKCHCRKSRVQKGTFCKSIAIEENIYDTPPGGASIVKHAPNGRSGNVRR